MNTKLQEWIDMAELFFDTLHPPPLLDEEEEEDVQDSFLYQLFFFAEAFFTQLHPDLPFTECKVTSVDSIY